ncbi:hypothetical protein [Candidatus Lokiarchaeum ossiferum]
MDHHLLINLREFLDYEAYWPEDIANLPADAMVLIDSNILLHFCDHQRSQRERIRQMFTSNPSVTFILSANILEEMGRVYHRKFDRSALPSSLKTPSYQVKETDIAVFVEDFGRFESGKARRKRKARQKTLIQSKYPRKTKWERMVENY